MKREQKLLKQRQKAVQRNDDKALVNVCFSLARLYEDEAQYNFAIEQYKTIAAIYLKSGEKIEYGTTMRGIGEAYLNLKEFGKCLEHFNIYLDIARECKNKPEQQRALATIGHAYLSHYLLDAQAENKEHLHSAQRYLSKSLRICQNLDKSVSASEIGDMRARLYLNFGLVEKSLGNFIKAQEFMNQSVQLCKKHDIHNILHKSYMEMAAMLEGQGKFDLASQNYKLAIDVAERIKDEPILLVTGLSSSAHLNVRLEQYESARNSLLRAYKLDVCKKEREQIANELRIVEDMKRCQEQLVETNDTDYARLTTLYEKLGDGCCEFKSFKTAIEYYKKTLENAEKSNAPTSSLATYYYSLAITYRDDGNHLAALTYFDKELNLCKTLANSLNTLSLIADIKQTMNAPLADVSLVYTRAISLCQAEANTHEEGRMVKRFVAYLRAQGHHSAAFGHEQRLAELNYVSSESDDAESVDNGAQIGAEIDISELVHDESGRKTRQNFKVKRNVKGETQLHTACIKGNLKTVQNLIDLGHPVNVKDNSGWYPIHEASNFGHYDVVALLLERGASANERGDGGVTALHDAAANGHFRIVALLLDKGANVVAKTDKEETVLDMLNDWKARNKPDEDEKAMFEAIYNRISPAIAKVSVISPKAMEVDNTPFRDNRKSVLFGLEEDECPESATTSGYKTVMANLRCSGVNSRLESRPANAKRSALIAEESMEEDWLEDDVGVANKRRKSAPVEERRRSPKTTPVKVPPRAFSSDFEPSCSYISDGEVGGGQRRRKVQSTLVSAGFNRLRTSPERRLVKQKFGGGQRKKSQTKLTNLGHTRNVVQADSSEDSVVPIRPASLVRNQSFDLGTPLTNCIEPSVCFDVKIDDKWFRFAVLLAKVNVLTIRWLAGEAATRYTSYKEELMQPILELQTLTGAILCNDDPLSMLFPLGGTQAEKVEARVVKWNIPPVTERYKSACITLETQEIEKIAQALTELSIHLRLPNCGLKGVSLVPLCKALNRQNNLLELDLSGNFLNGDCFRTLSASLASLEHLSRLNLSCVGLTSAVFQIFNSLLADGSLSKLSDLDLSDNFLSEECFESLSLFFTRFSLKSLNLSLNKFKNVFGALNNQFLSLNISNVFHFDISDNELDNASLSKIMAWLEPQCVKSVNISRNSVKPGFLKEFFKLWPDGNSLRNFEGSHCNLEDADLYSLISNSSQLESVDLSYNSELTCVSLNRLFDNNTLVNVRLIGCGLLFRHFNEFTRFVNSPDLTQRKTLKLSVTSQEAEEGCDYLVRKWLEWFGDGAVIRKSSKLLVLSTKE